MAWTDFMKGLLREDANFDILGEPANQQSR